MIEGRGVLNAPVELRCRRSNSSCSLGGRRGGAGPVANVVRTVVVEKRRVEDNMRRDWRMRDILCMLGAERLGIGEFEGGLGELMST
jgi:hypothetical protein